MFSKSERMRPVFVGNFGYDTQHSELERLFLEYGRVDRIDMKHGYAFVYFEDDRDGDDAIHYLDNKPFGLSRRRLNVEWGKSEKDKDLPKTRPSKTLFVVNFDPVKTRVRDLAKHFENYGKIVTAQMRRNYGFVQFESQEEATRALEDTHLSKLLDRVISVVYARGDERRYWQSPSSCYRRRSLGLRYRRRSRSPIYRSRPIRICRSRPSPDYGRGASSPPYHRR